MMTETEIEQAVASALAKARAALDESLAKGIAEAEAHRNGEMRAATRLLIGGLLFARTTCTAARRMRGSPEEGCRPPAA